MSRAHIELDKQAVIAPVRRRTFGSFVEHLGRCVYTGIYEPEHPSANDDGFRMDVVELVRELGSTTIRYPGGNFVSGFRWEDSVGPREKRPVRRDLAWHSLESNQVGLDEFARWLKLTDSELMLAVNVATRGILPALDLLEYANHPSGTALSDLRDRQRHAGSAQRAHVVPRQRDGRAVADRLHDRGGLRQDRRPHRRRDEDG